MMEDTITHDEHGYKHVITCTYHDLNEFADAAQRRQNQGPGLSNMTVGAGHADSPHSFMGRASRNDVMEWCKNGWNEHLDATLTVAEDAVETAVSETPILSFTTEYDVGGDVVDIGRYLSGEPECMVNYIPHHDSKLGRVITLCANVGYSASIKPATIVRRGQIITAFALALTRMGHACEIWLDQTIDDDRKGTVARVRVLVKSANDTLDPSRILFAFAHPGVQRYLVFAVQNGMPKEYRPAGIDHGTYGHLRGPVKDLPEGTIYLPPLISNRDVPDAHEGMLTLLRQTGLID